MLKKKFGIFNPDCNCLPHEIDIKVTKEFVENKERKKVDINDIFADAILQDAPKLPLRKSQSQLSSLEILKQKKIQK